MVSEFQNSSRKSDQ